MAGIDTALLKRAETHVADALATFGRHVADAWQIARDIVRAAKMDNLG